MNKWTMTPSWKAGGIPSTGFSLSVETERGDTERDGQTCLMKPNYQARERGQWGNHFPSSAGHDDRNWQPYPDDPYSVESADRIHTVDNFEIQKACRVKTRLEPSLFIVSSFNWVRTSYTYTYTPPEKKSPASWDDSLTRLPRTESVRRNHLLFEFPVFEGLPATTKICIFYFARR